MNFIKAKNRNVKVFKNRMNKTFKTPQKWDVIVNHITEGDMPGVQGWLERIDKKDGRYVAEVSCHYLVTRAGEVIDMNDLGHGTWHAVRRYPSAKVVKERPAPSNLYTVGIEHEGRHSKTQGRLTNAQYQATLALHKYIIEQYEATYGEPFLIDRDHIIGHYEVDTVNRSVTDPGREFPWEKLLTDLTRWDEARKAPPDRAQDRFNGPYEVNGTKLWFRAVAGSYDTRRAAEEAIARLKSEGYRYAWLEAVKVDDQPWFRAHAGSHDRRGPAEAEVDKLIADGYKGAWLQAVYLPIKEGK